MFTQNKLCQSVESGGLRQFISKGYKIVQISVAFTEICGSEL